MFLILLATRTLAMLAAQRFRARTRAASAVRHSPARAPFHRTLDADTVRVVSNATTPPLLASVRYVALASTPVCACLVTSVTTGANGAGTLVVLTLVSLLRFNVHKSPALTYATELPGGLRNRMDAPTN